MQSYNFFKGWGYKKPPMTNPPPPNIHYFVQKDLEMAENDRLILFTRGGGGVRPFLI